jgi:hypothetical protein
MTHEFNKADLMALLIGLGYSAADANGMLPELLAMQAPIREAFMHWWQQSPANQTTNLPVQPVYEGFNTASLANQYHLRPVAAFLTLDWLATEPEIARKALSEGYDEILSG